MVVLAERCESGRWLRASERGASSGRAEVSGDSRARQRSCRYRAYSFPRCGVCSAAERGDCRGDGVADRLIAPGGCHVPRASPSQKHELCSVTTAKLCRVLDIHRRSVICDAPASAARSASIPSPHSSGGASALCGVGFSLSPRQGGNTVKSLISNTARHR